MLFLAIVTLVASLQSCAAGVAPRSSGSLYAAPEYARRVATAAGVAS